MIEANKALAELSLNIDQTTDLDQLVSMYRSRKDLMRAKQRLDLQCQSMCRRYLGATRPNEKDDEKANKRAATLWSKIQKNENFSADVGSIQMMLAINDTFQPYISAINALQPHIDDLERQLKKLIKKLPIWIEFAKQIRGIGEIALASVLGEAVYPIASYKSEAALWKRFGLAVFGDERQRKYADKELAELNGYKPSRRAVAWNVSECLIRKQNPKDKYRQIYICRKEYELTKDIKLGHANGRAKRYMVKAFLRDLWKASKRLESIS